MISALLFLVVGLNDPTPPPSGAAPVPAAVAAPPPAAPGSSAAAPPVVATPAAAAPPPAATAAPSTAPAPTPVAAPPERPAHPEWAELPEEARVQLQCTAENDEATPAVTARRHALVRPSYVLRIRALAGIFAGGDPRLKAGTGTTATSMDTELGYTVAGVASLGLLTPLQLDAGVRYMHGGSGTALHVDATAAFAFRSYGNRWIDAGSSNGGAVVYTWDAHCQLRRVDNLLFGGAKLIRETIKSPSTSRTLPALQIGYAYHHLARAAVDFSMSALWAPSKSAYGGQFSFGASRLLIALPIPVDFVYTNMNVGGLFGAEVANWWFTVDLGVAYEL